MSPYRYYFSNGLRYEQTMKKNSYEARTFLSAKSYKHVGCNGVVVTIIGFESVHQVQILRWTKYTLTCTTSRKLFSCVRIGLSSSVLDSRLLSTFLASYFALLFKLPKHLQLKPTISQSDLTK